MYKLVTFIIIFSVAIHHGYSQKAFKGEPQVISGKIAKELNQTLKSYQVLDFDRKALRQYLNQKSVDEKITLAFGREEHTMKLHPNEIRSSSYTTTTDGNKLLGESSSPCITYAGYLDDHPDNYI